MIDFQIGEEPISTVVRQADVPILFEYDSIFMLASLDNGLGGLILTEKFLDAPQIKDYDAIEGEGPASWPDRFDLSNWGFIVARNCGKRIGGAVIAYDSPGVEMLEGRRDLAVLWDLRVDRTVRGQGLGAALFAAAELWARERGCRQLKVETQNINVAACRFYARLGCTLGAINRFAYPSLPEEIQLLWYKELAAPGQAV
jgi:GNAT superfamily N-acetyltransferase